MSLTPDGVRYLAASEQRVAKPFHYRWLLPTICRQDERRWRAVRAAALIGLLPALFWLAGGGRRGLFVALLAVGCAGVWRFNWAHPVLVDAPAFCLGILSAAAATHGMWWLCVITSCSAGMTKETSPLFAALFAWSPVPLVGLLMPAGRSLWRSGRDVLDEENAWILAHPVRAAIKYHRGLPAGVWVLPWGACLVGLAHSSGQLLAVLTAAYAQCAVATDTVRLYQWAYPTLAIAASNAVSPSWFPVLLAVHLVNPFAGSGL